MLQQLLLYFMTLNIPSIYPSCSVSRVIMRVPRENDIGLIFDLTVANQKREKSEMLEFTVNSNGVCTLNLTNGKQVKAGTIFGGDFGSIEPGSSVTVSLVWPTVSLYNRVGSCPIVISTTNHLNEVIKTNQILYFDTRFETLDPSNHSLRRRKDFTDCKNWDKNYLRNCTPLNCEERYFGKRSFYNRTTGECEPVPPCFGEGVIYDFYANECMDMNNFITDEEIEQLKQGKFDNNLLELQPYVRKKTRQSTEKKTEQNKQKPRQMLKECNFASKLSLVDFNNCFQHLKDVDTSTEDYEESSQAKKLKKKSTATSILKSFYYDWYMPLNKENDLENTNHKRNSDDNSTAEETHTSSSDEKSDNYSLLNDKENPIKVTSGTSTFVLKLGGYSAIEWFIMTMEMLLIIVVTFFTYAVVCTTLYGFLEILAELQPYKVTGSHLSKKLTPRHRLVHHEIMTSASLMSQLK
ncbi:uncharacterized protein LOC135426443 isoform X2 [Drosophila montana]|uniref:uncharacterized protein LOC135426443 isoform X2 n=1 Tax=Drosophila montana TaxID=40370 RepID=UPI00313EC2D3